jgi:hypothetical protein
MDFKTYLLRDNEPIDEKKNPVFFSYVHTYKKNKARCIRRDIYLDLARNQRLPLYLLCQSLGFKNTSKLLRYQLIDLLRNMENKPINFY